ncbi:Outer membrane receptor proteins, mostly Fe transport [Chitinophaga terrae (ex Kim and Jung 2007)]|uniref:Outer membrane receptor proteins, mostly Fe transport n=2 Tax=Chitinophaga terrae (ex Kim and Jung 2007) TaxID=408074 RepID=A0A1H4EU79_9BACT|nr:Outer membrane receptor proteins, mostly Fe transport [Chitinophaga terrae (ex Kim and Jung 2007)]
MHNFTTNASGRGDRRSHAWRFAKGLLIGLVVIVFFTNPLLAQNGIEKMSVSLSQVPLSGLIRQIETQSSYVVNLVKEEVDLSTKVTVNIKDGSVQEVLSQALRSTPYHFKVEKDVITIQRKPAGKPEKGRVIGQVLDAKDGTPVIGATIQIGSGGTITDIDGKYAMDITPGTYSLQVSSTGYVTKKINQVIVNSAIPTQLDITLNIQKGTLKGVEVVASAKRESIASLYLRQKNSASISDGISLEQITRTPDKNLGETLKRISGVTTVDNKFVVVRGLSERYNQSVLNGQVMPSTELNRRNFSFDIIPSNIVENITVVKTLTPDRSAEFGGGLVEVNTVDIPTQNFLNVSVGGGFNNQTTGKDFVSMKLEGREYLAQPAKHRDLYGRLDWKSSNDVLEAYKLHNGDPTALSNNWGLTKMKAQPNTNYQLAGGHVFKYKNGGQLGVMASASYRNTLLTQEIRMSRDGYDPGLDLSGDNVGYIGKRYGFTTNLGGIAGIGYTNKHSKISFQSLYLRSLDQQLQLGGPEDRWGYYDLTTQTTLWQNQLRGEHALGSKGIKLKWMGSYIRLDRKRPDNHQLTTGIVQVKPEDPADYNVGAPGSTGISAGALRWWSRAYENNYTWDLALSAPFNFDLGSISLNNTVKVGYAGWSKDRSFYVINTGSTNENKIYASPLSQAFSPENGVSTFIDRFGDNFHRTMDLHAGYLMLDDKIADRWRLVWGVRAEYYNLNNANANLDQVIKDVNTAHPDQQFDFSAVRSREPNLRFFPSANLTYSLNTAMNLRLAYSQSIIRPDLRELSFFREYDFELGGNYSATLVRSTLLKHLDFRYEWYPAAGEVLSLSLFYKKIDYPMEIYKQGDFREFELLNNRWAKNYGIEAEIRKSFAFTKVPVLQNLTVFGNFTRLFAEVLAMRSSVNTTDPNNPNKIVPVEVLGSVQKRPQSGASNMMLNAGLYYDTKPVSLSVSYNYISNRMFRPTEIYQESLFERPIESLDAQLAIHLLKNRLEFKINVANLLNSYSLVYYNKFSDNPDVRDGKKAPTAKQLLYRKGESFIDFEARPGMTWSGVLSYRF